jgi:hypothetical protein
MEVSAFSFTLIIVEIVVAAIKDQVKTNYVPYKNSSLKAALPLAYIRLKRCKTANIRPMPNKKLTTDITVEYV